MGEVLKFPTSGMNCNNKYYNPASYSYWKSYCAELDAKQIERVVLSVSGYSLKDIRKHNRKPAMVDVRQLFVLLCLEHTSYSYPTIAAILDRDHTTIMSLAKRKMSPYLHKMVEAAQSVTRYLTTT